MRIAVNGIALRGGRILLVRKNKTWILPGGKPEQGESDLECLAREFKKELPETKIEVSREYKTLRKGTSHSKEILEARAYFVDVNGNAKLTTNEIEEARWFYYRESLHYKVSHITRIILGYLNKGGYL